MVSIPHFFATALRFWRLRSHVNRRVLLKFGIPNAIGGLAGAVLHNVAANRALAIVFGVLLVFVGLSELRGLARRMEFGGTVALIAGAVSGFLGGLVGNQGGSVPARCSASTLAKKPSLRPRPQWGLWSTQHVCPAYFITQGGDIKRIWILVLTATLGALIGTLFGERLLKRIPEDRFRQVVAVLLLLLGAYMITKGRSLTSPEQTAADCVRSHQLIGSWRHSRPGRAL